MHKKKNNFGKKFAALMLALSLATQPIATVSGNALDVVEAAESDDSSVNKNMEETVKNTNESHQETNGNTSVASKLETDTDDNNQNEEADMEGTENNTYIDFTKIENQDFTEGVDAEVKYNGTTATITGADWGNDWGADSKWQIQLKEMIPVTIGEKYDISFTITSEVTRDVFLKLGDVANNNTVFLEETISLEAGKPYTYNGTSSAVDIENLMVLFALGAQSNDQNTITISNLSVTSEKSGAIEVKPYINFENIVHNNTIDGADAVVTYAENTATITGADWGNDWGADSKWQIQLKEMIPVVANEKYDISFTITSKTARDVFLKLGDVANNNTAFLEETISLEAGKPYTYTVTTTDPVTIEDLMVLFALGDQSTDENTITITDLIIKGEKSGYITAEHVAVPDEKGPEYDFTATDLNEANDVKDPGNKKDGYDLIWSDEFDGKYDEDANIDKDTGLNLDNWNPQNGDGTLAYGNTGWGNAELQAYTGRKDNVGVNEDLDGDEEGDGLLRITASYEEDGYNYETETPKSYTSARLHSTKATDELFNTTYGYIEARMALPGTKGAWPAFWMLPQSTAIYGGWPVSGEIDIMETCGAFSSGVNDMACGTLHRGAPNQIYSGSGYVELNSDYTYFHTYAIDWEPGKITWYYDGKPIHTEANWESAISGASSSLSYDAPFDQPFYILLNLAVDSGRFGGAVNAANFQDDINMYVDYVRVYQKNDGYADSVVRTSTGEEREDWTAYEGKNQIGEIKEDCVATLADGNVNALETSGKVEQSKWYLGYQADATDATAEMVTGEDGKQWAKVGVNTAGGQDYSVQLIGHYNAKAGYVYKVSFDTYAEGDIVGKTVTSTSKEWKGWSTYGSKVFTLSDTVTSNSYLISQKDDFEDCRIEFNLGAVGTGNVYIGNVKVEIVDPAMLGIEENTHAPLADGNVIYNGTFDQGNYHLGYWTAGDGTEVVVPRYTTQSLADDDVSVVDVASTLNNFEEEAKANGGVKYYERRAQISAKEGTAPSIYQAGIPLAADEYTLNFDMYSKEATTVTAAIYESDEDGVLGKKRLESKAVDYTEVSTIKNYTWSFETPVDLENAALVLTFGDGASVQIDNVSMLGASQGTQVDMTPVDAESTWTANDGAGNAIEITTEEGVHTVADVSSGTTWYSPQITSSTFTSASGVTYKLSAKVKLEGTHNNKITYIVQEQNGSWAVVYDIDEIDISELGEPDADGFYTYETTFESNVGVENVALNFGLGNSKAENATFSFKDVAIETVVSEEEDGVNKPSMDTAYDNWEDVNKTPEEDKPTTEAPTTEVPTTEKPTTEAPTTELPWNALVVSMKLSDTKTEQSTQSSTQTAESGKVGVTEIKIIGESDKIAAGKSIQLKASVAPSNATEQAVKWKSSNETYATVDANGKVTVNKDSAGKKVDIIATAADGSGKTATYTIQIMKNAVKKVAIKGKKTRTVTAGKTLKLKASVITTGKSVNKTLIWSSSNTKFATVSKSGKVVTKKAGKNKSVKITAVSTDGSNKKATVKIKLK